MTMTDPVADLLTRVRNANTVGHTEVSIPHSKLKEGIAKVLEREGFIAACEIMKMWINVEVVCGVK